MSLTFTCFAFLQVIAGATSSIWATSCVAIFLFVAFKERLLLLLHYFLLVLPCCDFSWCLFCLVSCLICLHWKSACYINLRLLVFVPVDSFAYFFASYLLIHIYITLQTSCLPSIPPYDPLWPAWPSPPTSWFFALCTCVTKHPLLTHLGIFLPCFCPHPCQCIHSRPSEPLCTHLHASASFFDSPPKTWCPGKFPRP